MFEGLVRQLLQGYLGSYVKDFQREQLKITLWNEEVLLENVELILEAFDYLQLPFALREGRVGRLSIKIPWKKLGWDPIIIILEDVFISASQRDEEEWSPEAVDRREYAAKKAKLVTAELAKLSRRVSDNKSGRSFISYITAKILDSIQVSIRNFHILYCDVHYGSQTDPVDIILGLKFSSLTIMKQTTLSARGLVNKAVEVVGFEIYCSSSNGSSSLSGDSTGDSQSLRNGRYKGNSYNHILGPLDVYVSLLVDRSGRIDDDAPQFSVNAEISNMVIALDEVQLHQILLIWDKLCISQIREKYGRYRPWSSPLSSKLANWQKLWWRYALESVLSDVRRTLQKSSWRYFGERLSYCRQYVNLYKQKLLFLRQDQSIEETIIQQLEQMEKESDIDDIINYRSVAERELEELVVTPTDGDSGLNGLEKLRNSDQSSSRPRGWLNWLSRGMLGAGGTEDSSQFSGVVSDEVIKDIYEATEFRPPTLINGAAATDRLYRCGVKFSIHEISAIFRSMKSRKDTAKFHFNEASIEYKVWEESSSIVAVINSIKVTHPQYEKVILLIKKDTLNPSCRMQVDVTSGQDVQISSKIAIEPLKVSYDSEFFMNIMKFYDVLQSVEFQPKRVLSSLNGIRSGSARLLSKSDYILATRGRIAWDINVNDILINIPWTNATLEHSEMVLGFEAFTIMSHSGQDDQSSHQNEFVVSNAEHDYVNLQLQDLYDRFIVKVVDFQVKITGASYHQPLSVLEKFSASIMLALCIIPDESIDSIPKQLEVYITASTFLAHFSPSIYTAAMGLISYLDRAHQKFGSVSPRSPSPYDDMLNHARKTLFGFSLAVNLREAEIHVDFENGVNSTSCILSMSEIDIRCNFTDFLNCWMCTKAIKIICYPQRDKRDSQTLCLLGSTLASNSGLRSDATSCQNYPVDEKNCTDNVVDGCFLVRYEASRRNDSGPCRCMINLNDCDLHCYPYAIGLLVGFFDQLAKDNRPEGENSSVHLEDERTPLDVADLGCGKFGFSNFLEPGFSESPNISVSHFPFVSVHNSGCLNSLESSLLYFPDWRKHVITRQRKPGNKSTLREELNSCFSSSLKSTMDKNAFPVLETSDSELFLIDLNLRGIRVQFHDHSCTVGIITLPSVKSAAFICNDSVDIMCSTEGLILTSSWWTQSLHDFLWGPSSEEYSPILNVRVKIQKSTVDPQTEVSIGIQHVCCILPPDYLAILIGYFSLPDWTPNLMEQLEENKNAHDDNRELLVYKVEILDSDLFFPIEIGCFQFLKLDIPQLHFSFICDSLNGLLESIPAACLVQENKVAKRSHCLNIFGRQIFLSLLMLNDEDGSFTLAQEAGVRSCTLIASFDADVWVRIPVSSPDSLVTPTCIMGKINDGELVVDDRYLSDGLEALSCAINEFSSVEDRSKGYTGDLLQSLGTNRFHKIGSSLPDDSNSGHTEVLLSVNLLTVKLNNSALDSMITEPVAKAEMQFTCSLSLKNDIPKFFKLSFTSFSLHSLYSSVILVRCSATCFTSSVLDITFSVEELLKDEVSIFLPSLEVWLELIDWMKVLDTVNFARGKAKTVGRGPSSSDTVDSTGHTREAAYGTSSLALSDNASITRKEGSYVLVLRLENMGVMCHCPLPLQNHTFCSGESVFQQAVHIDVSPDVLAAKHRKFVSVSMCSRSTELFLTDRSSKIKTCIEKVAVDVGVREGKLLSSWPLFQIIQVSLEAEICNDQTDILHVATEMLCDHVDISLSHQIFSFWHDTELNFSVEGSSQFAIGNIDCKLNFRKVSVLLMDGRLSCSGPLLEVLSRNLTVHAKATKTMLESSVASDLQVNYNNIHKVTWEPFIEPWKFLISITRKREISVLLKSSIITELYIKSVAQLNLNITESFFECVCRTVEMMKDALGLMTSNGISKSSTFLNPLVTQNIPTGRDAPYVIQNLTSLSLAYCTFLGPANLNECIGKELKDWNYVQPGSSLPIFISQTAEEQLRFRPASSSDRLNEKQSNGTSHRYIVIQLDGTSLASIPISMDLVGVSYFEVDFSKASSGEKLERTGSTSRLMSSPEERDNTGKGFVVPVVFDVSVQRFSKLIRLYSTVIVLNETPMPLELRFDIPFGVSPKVLDPIIPAEQFPLPLHLAESGRVRLRPQGNSYVWSEAHNLQTILSQDSKIGFLRSFVCYPSHLRGDPFRCCISVKKVSLPLSAKSKDEFSKRFLYQLALSTPLVIHNYLPEDVSLIIEIGGVKHPTLLSKVDTSFHQIDPSHDLGLEFHMPGYRLAVSRFSHAETFSTSAKFTGTNFTLSETLVLDPATSNGPIHVTLEKKLDAFSGARELFIYVPFLLYNCLGFPLDISDSASELTDSVYTMSSCYELVEEELVQAKKDGLSLISSNQDKICVASHIYSHQHYSPNSSMVSSRIMKGLPLITPCSSKVKPHQENLEDERATSDKGRHLNSLPALRDSNMLDDGHARVRAFSYSPCFSSPAADNMVRVRRHVPELSRGKHQGFSWSEPFPLDPVSGSISLLVPQAIQSAAYVVSVTSSALSEPFSGRTRAISFQPRFVISNACARELCYKQKGTDTVFYLDVGQHTHLPWTDTKRDLLVSICYSEPGWQWSGSFLPELLGDTQVKMRNYISGALNMIRVEVQYADVSIRDEHIVASLRGNSGTNLILLSDDDSGYMPYRVENFSKERLRIYQQKCENFETIVHSYHSCPYAWDEPCYPHRLVLEVPGERVLGSYALDDVNESMTVHLPATSEKPERMLLVSVHAEGATKVLGVVDSSYHMDKDIKDPSTTSTRKKNKPQQKRESFSDYNEKVSISIPYIGISLINSIPQELLFACAKGLTIDILQSVDQQKLSFQVSSLQIDNLLHAAQYPVILSFDGERRSRSDDYDSGYQNKCEDLQIHGNSSCESVIYLAVAKWRKKDASLISFEYVILRVAEFHLELEQEVASHVSELLRTIYLRFQSGGLPFSDPKVAPLFYDMVLLEDSHPPLPDLRRPMANRNLGNCSSLPSVIPIGAPWQQICHLARRQKKIYVELFDLAPIKFSLSFCSSPWMVGFGIPISGESLMHRGLMALADIEGARIHLKQLTISHHMTGWESIREILIRHYSRQLLHEMYKVLGSAGVIGNPMGFARSLGLGIKDFLSVPTRHILRSPAGLVRGMAQGTTSLVSSTVYAFSDATSQFSKAAQKGIVALTFDEQAAAKMEQQQRGAGSPSQGVINEVLEGLTGLLQSPIRGAEKHGLPGVLSGMALGLTGLLARPAASILEVTGKTAQSIRNRSKHYHHQSGGKRLRVRLPRPLRPDLPLKPYSWEEAIGTCVLLEAASSASNNSSNRSSSSGNTTKNPRTINKDDDQVLLVTCKALKEAGKFVVITERLIIAVRCSSLVDFDKPEFQGIAANPEWVIESEVCLDSIIHCDADESTVHIVGSASSSDGLLKQKQQQQGNKLKGKWHSSTTLPLFQTDLELASCEDAQLLLTILLSTIEHGKEGRWGTSHVLHRTNIR